MTGADDSDHPNSRYSMLDARQHKKVSHSAHLNPACPKSSKTPPQITQIDADNITNRPGPYLRYLRHLREDMGWEGKRESIIKDRESGGWVDRVSRIENRVSSIEHLLREPTTLKTTIE
jgi:hypothetical protein